MMKHVQYNVVVESEITISVRNIRRYAKTATLVVKTTTVDIARTILSQTTKTVETATADRYVKSADVDVVTVWAKRQQRRPTSC